MVRRTIVRDEEREFRVSVDETGVVTVNGVAIPTTVGPGSVVRLGEHESARAWVIAVGESRWVYLDGRVHELELEVEGRRRRTAAGHGSLSAPMPATVVRVEVSPGAKVHRGDTLVILEAMKMELPVRADADGTVASVRCKPGELVQPGMPLIELE